MRIATVRNPTAVLRMSTGAGAKAAVLCLAVAGLFRAPMVVAQVPPQFIDALRNASYTVFSGDVNSDGRTDLLVKAKLKIAVIDLDDLAVPIVIPPSSPTFVLLSSGNDYVLDAQPNASVLNSSVWQPGGYELIYGDLVGEGAGGMVIRSQSGGGTSFSITTLVSTGAPQLLQALTSATLGVDLGASNVTTDVVDQNNDGRADLVVKTAGRVSTVLLADANGLFHASSSNAIQAAWFGMLSAMTDGNSADALAFIAEERRPVYQTAFANMGTSISMVRPTLTNFALIQTGTGFARFVVDQTINGTTRMHFVDFIQTPNGDWAVASF